MVFRKQLEFYPTAGWHNSGIRDHIGTRDPPNEERLVEREGRIQVREMTATSGGKFTQRLDLRRHTRIERVLSLRCEPERFLLVLRDHALLLRVALLLQSLELLQVESRLFQELVYHLVRCLTVLLQRGALCAVGLKHRRMLHSLGFNRKDGLLELGR